MTYYPKTDFLFLKFERSHLKSKKYDAILQNKKTFKTVKIPFGAQGYAQFKDQTPLKLYSNFDHNDKTRRQRYKARHAKDINKPYSASWFSSKYLW